MAPLEQKRRKLKEKTMKSREQKNENTFDAADNLQQQWITEYKTTCALHFWKLCNIKNEAGGQHSDKRLYTPHYAKTLWTILFLFQKREKEWELYIRAVYLPSARSLPSSTRCAIQTSFFFHCNHHFITPRAFILFCYYRCSPCLYRFLSFFFFFTTEA